MAAALALAFQSSHLQDGLFEFLTMVRGCNLIAGDEALNNADSAFHVGGYPSLASVGSVSQAFPIITQRRTLTLTYLRLSAKMDIWRRCEIDSQRRN
jgi:hypothetical protein